MQSLYVSKKRRNIIKITCLFVAMNIVSIVAIGQLAVWNATSASGFGVSPFAPTTLTSNLTSSGLIRGSGVGVSGNAAAGGWGGTGWAATPDVAVNTNAAVSFDITPADGYAVYVSTLSLHYRRSAAGPTTGLLQYSIGGGPYITATIISFSSTSSTGADITAVNLQGIAALQNVTGSTIAFRLVPYGGTSTSGTWYVYKAGMVLDGSVEAVTNGSSNCQTITFSNDSNLVVTGIGTTDSSSTALDGDQIIAEAWTCNAISIPTCNSRALVRLDVSSIAPGSSIASAKLKLYADPQYPYGYAGSPTYGSANAGYLQKITNEWAPNVSWKIQPSVDTASEKSLPKSTTTTQNYEVDITDFVQSWIDKPDSNFGMMFRLQVEQYYNSLIFHAGKPADPVGLRPQLTVCFSTPTPLHLVSFNGNLSPANTIQLNWASENEVNVSEFELCRSINGIDFSTIATEPATNKSGIHYYGYADNIIAAKQVYYRLKIIDNNGHITYSRIVTFSTPLDKSQFSLVLSPNPAQDYVQAQINVPVSSLYTALRILDATGRQVFSKQLLLVKGLNNILIPEISTLSKGIYFVTIGTDDKSLSQKLLVK